MARDKDLWFSTVTGPDGRPVKQKTARHPDRGGNRKARRWLGIYTNPDGQEKSQAFRTQAMAKKWAAAREAEVERGEWIDPAAGNVPVGAEGQKWLRLRRGSYATRARYESVLRNHVGPAFGHRPVRSVKPSELAGFFADLARTHGFATQEAARIILCGIFDQAAADGLRRDNPMRSPVVPRPKQTARERAPWTVERIWAVTQACPDLYQAIPVADAGLGLRPAEGFALALEDFDFDTGVVHIRRQVTRAGTLLAAKLPKGGKTRTVPLPHGVAAAVRAYAAAHPPQPYTLPWLREDGQVGEDPCVFGLLFRWAGDDPRTHARHIRPSPFDAVWRAALTAAGVPLARENGMHVLRHWYSSCLMDAGVSLAGVMEFMGHSRKSQPVTLGVYGHATEATFEAARRAVDRSLFALRAVPGGTGAERRAAQ